MRRSTQFLSSTEAQQSFFGSFAASALALLLAGFIAVFTSGCTEKEFDPADPAASYAVAKEPFDDGNYEMALTKLGEFKSRFPYSQYAVEAELLVADTHYELGHFIEAAQAYEQFAKLHPRHPKVDYALYRVGEAYWQEAPTEVNRDQEYTLKAVEEWRKLIERLPESSYAKKAMEFVKEGDRRGAESIARVAAFYCKQEVYHACAYRYIELLDRYKQFPDLREKAAREGSRALEEVAKVKEKDPSSDKNLYFKTMTADQIRAKAAEVAKSAAVAGPSS